MCLHFPPQWGRLVHGVLAVRTGVSALLPEVWPPASPLSPERRRSALPARPSSHRPAHQWRGEDGAPHPCCLLFTRRENSDVSMCLGSGWSLFLGSSSSPWTLQESLSKPGSGWEPNTRRTSNSRTIRACARTHHLFISLQMKTSRWPGSVRSTEAPLCPRVGSAWAPPPSGRSSAPWNFNPASPSCVFQATGLMTSFCPSWLPRSSLCPVCRCWTFQPVALQQKGWRRQWAHYSDRANWRFR